MNSFIITALVALALTNVGLGQTSSDSSIGTISYQSDFGDNGSLLFIEEIKDHVNDAVGLDAYEIPGTKNFYLLKNIETPLKTVIDVKKYSANGKIDPNFKINPKNTHFTHLKERSTGGWQTRMHVFPNEDFLLILTQNKKLPDTGTTRASNYEHWFCKFKSTGQLDSSFGSENSGCTEAFVGGITTYPAVRVNAKNEIFFASTVNQPDFTYVYKLDPSGKRNPNFGNGGAIQINGYRGSVMTLDPLGDVFLISKFGSDYRFVKLFGDSGKLDYSFGSGGEQVISLPRVDHTDFGGFSTFEILQNNDVLMTMRGRLYGSSLMKYSLSSYSFAPEFGNEKGIFYNTLPVFLPTSFVNFGDNLLWSNVDKNKSGGVDDISEIVLLDKSGKIISGAGKTLKHPKTHLPDRFKPFEQALTFINLGQDSALLTVWGRADVIVDGDNKVVHPALTKLHIFRVDYKKE